MIKSEAQQQLEYIRAAYHNDLSVLLRPYFTFRVFLKFKKRHIDRSTGKIKDANHCYGMEHSCSYSQCVNGHVDNILLNKQQGYNNCIYMIEEKFCDADGVPLYRFAQIYQRITFPYGKFDILNRHYNHKGERVEQFMNNKNELVIPQEALIDPKDNVTLYFKESGGLLTITEEPQPTAAEVKKMVSSFLET